MDNISRKEIQNYLGKNVIFSIRKVDFIDLARDFAYILKINGYTNEPDLNELTAISAKIRDIPNHNLYNNKRIISY